MLKTLGRLAGMRRIIHATIVAVQPALALIASSASGDGVGRADMHPQAFQPQPVQAAGCGGAVEQRGEREFAGRRVGKQRGRKDRRAGIDEGRHLALAARASGGRPRAMRKSPRPA